MANGLFIPSFRGAGSPGAPGVGTTRAAILGQQQAEAELARAARLQQLRTQLGQVPIDQQPIQQLGAAPQQQLGVAALQLPGEQPVQQLGPAITPSIAPPVAAAPSGPSRAQLQRQFEAEFPEEARQFVADQKAKFDNQTEREKQRLTSVANSAARIQGLPVDQQIRILEQDRARMQTQGITDFSDTDEQLGLLRAGRIDEANALTDQAVQFGQSIGILKDVARGEELTAAQREFAALTEELTPEQKKEATLIKLGLSPRAVGSALQTISAEGIAEEIGDAQATIKERAKFGELTGASRSKAIDSGFARIVKLDKNIVNLDRAIAAVEAGAGVGAIESRFPSIRAASVELDQIQGELALDVIGAVTFGALSEGELNLSKQIALPTGLDGPQLIQHLRDRKAAQQKLRAWFNEQIEFLDQGGTIAGFLRNKERQTQTGGTGGATQVGRFTVEAE